MRCKNRIKLLFRLLKNAKAILKFHHKCKGTRNKCQASYLIVRKLKIRSLHLCSRTLQHASSTTSLHARLTTSLHPSKRTPISSRSIMLRLRKFSLNTLIPSRSDIYIKYTQVHSNNGKTGLLTWRLRRRWQVRRKLTSTSTLMRSRGSRLTSIRWPRRTWTYSLTT